MTVHKWRYKFERTYAEQWICVICAYVTKDRRQKCPRCGATMEYRVVKK